MKAVQLVFPGKALRSAWFFGHASAQRWPAVGALAGATAVLGAVVWTALALQQDTSTVRSAAAALRMRAAQVRGAHDVATKPALTAQQTRDWIQVTRRLNTPWPTLLNALETSTPDDVALISIESDPERGSVRLQAEAKSLDTLLAYIEALRAADPFDEAVPVRHETNDQDATRPMRLAIDARLKARPNAVAQPEATR